MFIRFSDSSAQSSAFVGSGSYQDDSIQSTVESILYIFEVGLNIFTIFLNVWVCGILFYASSKKGKEFKDCFYIIMRTFTIFVALNAAGSIIALMDRKNATGTMNTTNMIQSVVMFNMFTYFASSLWLFYAGLNRMLVLLYPNKFSKAFACWIVRGTLFTMTTLAAIGAFISQKMCDIQSRYDEVTNTVQIVAGGSMAEPVIILVNVFPLASLVFYAIAYRNLQQKRLLVVSDKTIGIIDRAERKTLKIGVCIMVTYTIALVGHLIVSAKCDDSANSAVLIRIDEIVSMTPQFSVPLVIFGCNHKLFVKMRKLSLSLSLSKRSASVSASRDHSDSLTYGKLGDEKSCKKGSTATISTVQIKTSEESHSH